ncbi:hypothetical protein [Chitinophaga sp. RAB17]|uniref:hypothetical protein n=1 Tax=Chitinophaga sp. RAB17 TaxID=3233049 RepID=UPI003F928C98
MENTRTPDEMLQLIKEYMNTPRYVHCPEPIPIEESTSYIITQPVHVLVSLVEQLIAANDIASMEMMAEFFRAEGYFYMHATHHDALLELMMRYAIALPDQPAIFSDFHLIRYIMTLYDLIFHQVHFDDEYPEGLRTLYFQMNLRIMDTSLIPLRNITMQGMDWFYSQCIYFIEMKSWCYTVNQPAFLELWAKYQEHRALNNEAIIAEDWQKTYNHIMEIETGEE